MGGRVLLTHRYFWPDSPPYASMLRSIAGALSAAGFEVHVFTMAPSYRALRQPAAPSRQRIDGADVLRAGAIQEAGRGRWARLLNVGVYLVRLSLHLLTHRYDVVSVASFPPVLPATLVTLLSRVKGYRVIYHCQDLHPEVDVAIGGISGFTTRWMRWLDRWTTSRADVVITLSDDMRQTLADRGGGARIRILNNFRPRDFDASGERVPEPGRSQGAERAPDALLTTVLPRPAEGAASPLTLVYAGNLGRYQGVEQFLERFLDRPELPVQLNIYGEGDRRRALEEMVARAGDARIAFHGQVPQSGIDRVLEESELGLVVVRPGVLRAAYPSKVLTYLAAGTGLLTVADRESELGRLIREEGIGEIAGPDDLDRLFDYLEGLASDDEAQNILSSRARRLYDERFSEEVAMREWVRIVTELRAEGRG